MRVDLVSRRALLACGASVVLVPTVAKAGSWCEPSQSGGETLCSSGLRLGGETVRQMRPHWCWAACIQTIFAIHGYDVAQDAIVHKIFGTDVDRSADCPEIVSAIDGQWTGESERRFRANGTVLWDHVASFERPDALERAAADLDSGNPLIFATDGHCMVLTGMTYRKDEGGKLLVDSLVVRDPWPTAPNRRRLRGEETRTSGLLCAVHVEAVSA